MTEVARCDQGVYVERMDEMEEQRVNESQLIYQWEKMGEETGGLIGKMIGLGVTTGLQSFNLLSHVFANGIYPKK